VSRQHELSQLGKIMSRIDTNSDGHIDLHEFTVAVSEMETMRWHAGIVVVVVGGGGGGVVCVCMLCVCARARVSVCD